MDVVEHRREEERPDVARRVPCHTNTAEWRHREARAVAIRSPAGVSVSRRRYAATDSREARRRVGRARHWCAMRRPLGRRPA